MTRNGPSHLLHPWHMTGAALALMIGAGAQGAFAQDADSEVCASAPKPVVALAYGSRYVDDDASRSEIDEEANADVDATLGPIDDFIRDLTRDANEVLSSADNALADCVIARMATWAEAEALSELDSFTANLSVGARVTGFAFVLRQVAPFTTDIAARRAVESWLDGLARRQITFWEEEATSGAKTGNLRVWSALGVSLIGAQTRADDLMQWGVWSQSYVLCTAREDGSLPQETKRGKFALHYQLHAVSALTANAAVLEDAGLSVKGLCDGALERAAHFALDDLEAEGAASESYAGAAQSYWDGTEDLGQHELAWTVPYASLFSRPLPASPFDSASNSKLGGDQTLLWPQRY